MGSFIGHAIPGSFFMMFALNWMIQAFRHYFKSFNDNGTPFRCRVTYPPFIRRWPNFDLEALLIAISCVIGLLIELRGVYLPEPVKMNNAQHATMYFAFGLTAILTLASPRLRTLLPNIELIKYLSMALSYFIEGILFQFHLYGRDTLDVQLHTLLVYTIYACVLACLLEMYFQHNPICVLARSFFTFLQGTWFWQAAFVLYNPLSGAEPWDAENHHQLMLVTCIYAWHALAVFLLCILVGTIIACVYQKRGQITVVDYSLQPTSNGYSALLKEEDFETTIDLGT